MIVDDKFKALSNETRREILLLLKNKPLCASDIYNHFNVSFATISFHLSCLEKCGFVEVKQKNRLRIYSLNITAFDEMIELLNTLI